MQTVLVTGSAGFIGFHLAQRWLLEGFKVVGIDSFSDYYDPSLKRARTAILAQSDNFQLVEGAIETPGLLRGVFEEHRPDCVLHLAAQAGVRHSIENPRSYLDANIVGTFELLEAARAYPPDALLLASTSSVYGANTARPYAETDKADTQVSFYAATKKATEAMAHSYAHLYDLNTTMFRFFTVYGPWGRPDMAPMLFASAIVEGRPIRLFNHGEMLRDFTYVDDLVEAVWRLSRVGRDVDYGDGDSKSHVAPFRVVNIGKSKADTLMEFVSSLETAIGQPAQKILEDMQPGDVTATHADTELLEKLTGYRCTTPLSEGIPKFVSWYREYFEVQEAATNEGLR